MDPALKKRLDERLVSGEITTEEYHAIAKVLATVAPDHDGMGAKTEPPVVEPRAMAKRPETKKANSQELPASSFKCPKCKTPQKRGVTYCSWCNHSFNPKPMFEISRGAIGFFLFVGLFFLKGCLAG